MVNARLTERQRIPLPGPVQELAGAGSVGVAVAEAFVRGIPMTMDVIRVICAILLPPLGVFLQVGLGGQFWLNILLTLLGYIPGIVHAVWIIARR
jgi:uncharacterized membrane protein YqaE (UPF0057 family)